MLGITAPTKITKAQYANATYAVDRNNNMWIFWANTEGGCGLQENCLWIGQDENEWQLTIEAVGHENTEVQEITVPTPAGDYIDIEAITCPMKLCNNQLDIESLAIGEIEWI